jgi:hypothetical protein
MTTKAAEKLYLAMHELEMAGRKVAVFNPHNKPLEDLPVIYGFNNGGSSGWYSACLIAQDGTGLGGHVCSAEGYMWHDLGILEGTRPDRHEDFSRHYPDGYRMEFVSYDVVRDRSHEGLEEAYRLNQEKAKAAK